MLLFVHPWDRYLLEVDFADDKIGPSSEGLMDHCDKLPGSSPVAEESPEPHSRALGLMAHLGQPCGSFLLAQKRVREYNRITLDDGFTAQVKGITSIDTWRSVP